MRSRQAASMSGERISASPISTASTPARASAVELGRGSKPDSATTSVPLRDRQQLEGPSVSTSSVVRSRLLMPISRGRAPSAALQLGASWTSTSAARPSSPASAWSRAARRRQRGDDQQDRVGARRQRLVHLIGVDDEVLAQDRQRRGGAGRAQVVERAAEARSLGQDRERRGAAALVGADDVARARAPRGSAPPRASGACARRSATARAGPSASRNGRRPPGRARRSSSASGARAGVAAQPPPACRGDRSAPSASHAAPAPGCGRRTARARAAAAPCRSPPRRRGRPRSSDPRGAAGVDRRAGVEHGQVASGAGLAGEDPPRRVGVLAAGRRRGPARAAGAAAPTSSGVDACSGAARRRGPRPRASGPRC